MARTGGSVLGDAAIARAAEVVACPSPRRVRLAGSVPLMSSRRVIRLSFMFWTSCHTGTAFLPGYDTESLLRGEGVVRIVVWYALSRKHCIIPYDPLRPRLSECPIVSTWSGDPIPVELRHLSSNSPSGIGKTPSARFREKRASPRDIPHCRECRGDARSARRTASSRLGLRTRW